MAQSDFAKVMFGLGPEWDGAEQVRFVWKVDIGTQQLRYLLEKRDPCRADCCHTIHEFKLYRLAKKSEVKILALASTSRGVQ